MMRTAILSNPHPLDKYRVNNVLGNMPEFAKAFGCHKGQPMVHAERLPGVVKADGASASFRPCSSPPHGALCCSRGE